LHNIAAPKRPFERPEAKRKNDLNLPSVEVSQA
jgi:hypothetical protein